jgi:glycerol-3-phosphate acyltransferase PlsY
VIVLAALAGYLIGSIPSAHLLGQLRGINLREAGSGNPGTANALRVGGRTLAGAVLVFDSTKGFAAVALGTAIHGTAGAVAGALTAVLGQVVNPWFRFRGGKGLGVSGGALLAAWPTGLGVIVVVLALTLAAVRRAADTALVGLATLVVLAIAWSVAAWPTWWGIEPTVALVLLAAGIATITVGKFVRDLRAA